MATRWLKNLPRCNRYGGSLRAFDAHLFIVDGVILTLNSRVTTGEMKSTPKSTVRWLPIVAYYLLACAISWPFFWWRDMANESWRAWHIPGVLKSTSYMWGPGLAAFLCFWIFRRTHKRVITVAGSSLARSLLFYIIPLGAFALVGAPGQEGIFGHVLPLVIIGTSFLTVFGEELGWRGFLQDALRPLSPLQRYVLIGVLWEFWHFTNRIVGTEMYQVSSVALVLAVSYPAVIALSWLIGMAVERSRSLIVAHSIHLWVNLLFEFASWQTSVIFGLTVIFWLFLLKTWPGENSIEDKS